MKKLLITSALASSLIASVSLAEVKVGGGLEVTYGDKQTAATSSQKYVGAAIGYEAELDISASADLSNGMKVTTHFEYISDGSTTDAATDAGASTMPADLSMKVSSGNLTLYVGADDMEALDNNVVPKAYNLIEDNVTLAGTSTASYAGGGAVANSTSVGAQYKTLGGAITYLYAPNIGQGSEIGDNGTGNSGGSGYEVSYVGSPAENLSVILGMGKQNNILSSGLDTDTTVIGVAYNFGQFAVGASQTNIDAGTAATEYDVTYFGATAAVSDALTVGIQRMIMDQASTGTDEETDQLEVAYNLGGMTVAASYQKTKDAAFSSGSKGDAYGITLKTSF
jgi:hypothetical protein